MLAAPLNPNGRPNSDVIRQWVNAADLVQTSRGKWIIDFGIDMTEQEAALYEMPFEYVRSQVKPFRDTVRNTQERSIGGCSVVPLLRSGLQLKDWEDT